MERKAFLFGANTFGLKYANKDVDLLSKTLSLFDYRIVKPNLKKTALIYEFDKFIDSSNKSDLLLFYFSGHAFLDKGRLYFVINEGNLQKGKNTLPVYYFIDGLKRCLASNKLIILDCCNANASSDSWIFEQSDKFLILTASERLEKAKELDEIQASFLTYILNKALNEIPSDIVDNNKIFINKLYQWIIKSTSEFNCQNYTSQVPIPNLLGNQKVNFELANIKQIPENKTGLREDISESEISSIIEKIISENEEIYFTDSIKLEKLYDRNVKLYNHIFKVFYDKLSNIPHLKEEHPFILFNRILSFQKLEELDILTISKIRNNENFSWHERSLIVSALSLSLIRRLEETKLGLLIDFLTDFEPKVWERALVGIILSLKNKDQLIKNNDVALRRLKNLQFTPEILKSIEIIISILRNESYNLKKQIEKIGGKEIFADKVIELNKHLFSDFSENRSEVITLLESKEHIMEFISRIDENTYSLFGFNYRNDVEFFERPQNWFLPFYPENFLVVQKLKDDNINIDISSFLKGLDKSFFIDDIDKYFICLTPEISVDDFFILNIIGSEEFSNKVFQHIKKTNLPYDIKKVNYFIKRIREFYRYLNEFSEKKLYNEFQKRYDIYTSSLLEIITDEWHKLKILGDQAKTEGLIIDAIQYYASSLEYNPKNLTIILCLADSLFELQYKEEALKLYLEADNLSPRNITIIKKIALCYFASNNYSESLKYFLSLNKLCPDHFESLVYIAFFLEIKGYKHLAIDYYLKANKVNSDDFLVNKKIAELYHLFKEYESALKFYLKAMSIDPHNHNLLFKLGECYFYTNKFNEAYYQFLNFKHSANDLEIMNTDIDNIINRTIWKIIQNNSN